ncbi:hypothetical protein DSL72_004402 [Monilinia vaccinii-corymbosi]|uniref:CSC1/OSCA1-like 7TM region domain-containing protein n=1 Tax=Monilinia vaccinii-corymbosi TaxID=61207 RepID=A0A8A3P238_9HELO|nr:hypothetical protein DSL72_004402 [Monilinia vaccinii-corymbosi]
MDVGSMMGGLSKREKTDGQKLLDLLSNPFRAQLSQNSIYASFGTSIGFTLLLAIGFSLLRPYNSVVYAPKLKVADDKHAPPPVGKGPLAWIGPVLKTTESELVDLIGLDATIFLRVLRMCRNIFLSITVVGCGILIPINMSNGQFASKTDFVSRVTPVNVWGSSNWGMTICAWLFDLIVVFFLWLNYRAVLKLRRTYFASADYQSSLHARTLMINDIPKPLRTDEGIGRVIDVVAPESSFSRTAVARNVKELPELIEQHNQTVRDLEGYLAKYLKDPANLPAKRPECNPSKDDPNFGSYVRGQKLDAIEYLTARIRELEMEVKEVRLSVDNRNPLPYGFASFEAIDEAHSIAFAARNKHPKGTTIVLAPRPNDIIWKNMPLSRQTRRTRRIMNNIWVTLLTIVWMAPNAMISIFLVSLPNLGSVWPAFQDSLAQHTVWWSIVQGVASPAITSLVYLVLPIIFRRMLVKAGDRTKTARERHVTGKLYTFFVFNYLLVFSIFSTVWTFVSTVINKTNGGTETWEAIYETDLGLLVFISLCDISPFWVTWLLQRNLGAAVDLAQIWTLVWSFCARNFSSPTPREMIELTAPPAFDYASYYNYFLFYSTVTLCFGTIQPLVIPAAAMYFSLDVFLKKYLLLYIFITKTESGGMFWRMLFNRILFAAILANLVVFLATWVHGDGSHMEAYAVIPLPFLMICFKWFCSRTFDDKIHYYSVHNTLKDPEGSRSKIFASKGDRLASRFGHPALYKPLITPMVHARAQNILASVYAGRLTDSNNPRSGDNMSVSGYSDTYALDPMRAGQPGRAAKGFVPGFEMVPENRLDFSYYKGRAEFAEEHGGSGGIYGRAEDIVRSDTPGSSRWASDSRPGTPVSSGGMGTPTMPNFTAGHGRPGTPDSTKGGIGMSGGSGMGMRHYGERNDSAGEMTGLVQGAHGMPASTAHGPQERAPGLLGGGPGGYGNIPQEDLDGTGSVDRDPMNYDYFRSRRMRH